MVSEKRWIVTIVAVLMLSLFLTNGCGEKKSEEKVTGDIVKKVSNETTPAGDQGIGLPIYPGAKQDPEHPPINTPNFKNIHVLTSDPFDKVVKWYSQKLGEFDVDETPKKGKTQALWNKETGDGVLRTATISTINTPAGQVSITLVKMTVK